MLAGQKVEKTPLTKQVDRLTIFIIGAALFAFIAIVVMGLAQGESFTVLFGIGVALAVGSIPDALPGRRDHDPVGRARSTWPRRTRS